MEYAVKYNQIVYLDYERKIGGEGLVYLNKETIKKHREVLGYLFKTIGLNLLKGKSIMNVSLPINIFDVRSHLEVFAYQNSYAKIFLEKAANTKNHVERLKLVIILILL